MSIEFTLSASCSELVELSLLPAEMKYTTDAYWNT